MRLPASRYPLRLSLTAVLLALMPAACGEQRDEPREPVEIHAHRGVTLATAAGEAVPIHPENSMTAFRAAHAEGFTVEFDVTLTGDRVPVVMHDATLARTTSCTGRVDRVSARAIARCRLDVLGTAGVTAPNPRPERVPTLAEVLDWARAEGVQLQLEIKSPRLAGVVVEALDRSGVADDQVVIKSFLSRNLDVARDAGWRTALLTSRDRNDDAPDIAERRGFDILSPEWPLPEGFVERAGTRPVVPWTLDSSGEIGAALRARVDGIVSNNPELVRALAADE